MLHSWMELLEGCGIWGSLREEVDHQMWKTQFICFICALIKPSLGLAWLLRVDRQQFCLGSCCTDLTQPL